MKKIYFFLIILLSFLVSCLSQQPSDEVQRGDLLFVAMPYEFHAEGASEASSIRSAVASFHRDDCLVTDTLNIIHVAILDVVNDSLFVIDATIRRGVQRYPWADFVKDFTLSDGTLPTFFVSRLNNTSEVDRFIANARHFIGQPYDVSFTPDNGAMYCSELVRESYVTASGDTLFAQYPIDIRAPYGDVPPYWRGMFDKLGTSADDMGVGTWPNNMIHASVLHLVDVWLPFTEPADRHSFTLQADTLVQGLGPQLYSRVTPRDITVLDAYYYSFETSGGTREDNAVYTFLNHDTSDPAYYGIFAEDSLLKVFAAEKRYRTPVDANVERGEVEDSIAAFYGYWVPVQPLNGTFVYDNCWDFIPAVHLVSNHVEILTMDGVWRQNVMEFHLDDDGSFEIRLDGEQPSIFSGRFEPVDTLHRVFRQTDSTPPFFVAPAVKEDISSFEVVEYACRIPEILESYFSGN